MPFTSHRSPKGLASVTTTDPGSDPWAAVTDDTPSVQLPTADEGAAILGALRMLARLTGDTRPA